LYQEDKRSQDIFWFGSYVRNFGEVVVGCQRGLFSPCGEEFAQRRWSFDGLNHQSFPIASDKRAVSRQFKFDRNTDCLAAIIPEEFYFP